MKCRTIISENIDERRYSINYIVCYSLLAGHLAYSLIFLLSGIKMLVITNMIGTIIILIVLGLVKAKYCRAAILLSVVEFFTIVGFQIHYLGWSSGFQYYILCIFPILFLSEYLIMQEKIIITGLCVVYYVFILPFLARLGPVILYPQNLLDLYNNLNIIIVFVGLATIIHYFYSIGLSSETELKEANISLEFLSETDQLTGAFNRRHMIRAIENEINLFKIKKVPFVVAMADVDNFKMINDKCGHDCGDLVLREIIQRISKVIRQNDIVARWGGEELLLLLPETNLPNGLRIMERVREIIAESPIISNQASFYVTITAGLALYKDKYDLNDILKIADENLYRGKNSGKNCIIAESI